MYPFTKQLIEYFSDDSQKKIGMLILDVKGNYYRKVLDYAKACNRLDDIIVIESCGDFKYNPLHKPELKPYVIANQLKTILTLFSPNNSESYWLDKAEEVLREAIKFCRLYNSNYVTFDEIHKLITQEDFYLEKVSLMRSKFQNDLLSKDEIYNLISCLNFFDKEFLRLDPRTLNILKSEITRITNCFISDVDITKTFCPKQNELNFYGFTEVVNSRKNSNIKYEYQRIPKSIQNYSSLS